MRDLDSNEIGSVYGATGCCYGYGKDPCGGKGGGKYGGGGECAPKHEPKCEPVQCEPVQCQPAPCGDNYKNDYKSYC